MRGFDVHTLFYSIRTHVNRPISGQNATQNGDLAFSKFASMNGFKGLLINHSMTI